VSTDNVYESGEKHVAGAFDIRNFIGSLLAIFGVILLLMGLFGDPETEKTGGVNANLWAGIVLLVVGVGFMAWARLRPVVVPEHVEKAMPDPTRPGPGHH
jgi:high-affinity Fe2+/Pb2+ permease